MCLEFADKILIFAVFRAVAFTRKKLIMASLHSRCVHYIFALWFLSSSIFLSFFSSPNLSSRRLDVYHTLTHGVF